MGVAFIVIPFLPASNLLFRVGFVVAERVLYLPSVGFCVLVAVGFQKLSTFKIAKHVALAVFASLFAVFIARSIQRSNEWRSGIVLFKSATKVCPLNAKVHYNIAKTTSEIDEGSIELIIAHYRHAIELSPTYDQAMNNLANLLKDQGQALEAESLLDRAVSVS
ncbi:transmembrane and TPR repeat-containing protein 4 [Elysia marginata]|uniref:Transmembrane and TPR repeat-containing protein 4 n=1 Tax=Elysia marginata TaxID=1093978 RepID=A0AAV4IJ16_9GAST|nr:transmembrane and TPR repeat-containing protein 4 [Elysia marginata]